MKYLLIGSNNAADYCDAGLGVSTKVIGISDDPKKCVDAAIDDLIRWANEYAEIHSSDEPVEKIIAEYLNNQSARYYIEEDNIRDEYDLYREYTIVSHRYCSEEFEESNVYKIVRIE